VLTKNARSENRSGWPGTHAEAAVKVRTEARHEVPSTRGDVLVSDRKTRAERLPLPLARDVVTAVALEYGACIRPVQLRKSILDTGAVEQVMLPCGATLASVCPPCAERNKVLRIARCREGWHLEDEPIADPVAPDDYQKRLAGKLCRSARRAGPGRGHWRGHRRTR
jgi:hypothetical protein